MVNDIVLTSKGVNAPYFKSGSSNISATGILRLANNEGVGFRNAANGADLILKANASDKLEYNGVVLAGLAAALTASRALVSDGSGNVTVATTTTTELNYLAGVTTPTGSGALVLATSPTLVTPALGVATATSINKVAITAPATSATLTLADGKTLTVSNTLTFTGTDASSVAFGTGGSVAYAAGAFPLSAQYALITDINGLVNVSTVTQTRLQYLASAGGTTGTTSTNLVFSTSPTLVTPTLGEATATSINGSTIPTSKTLVVTTDKLSALAATTSAELAGVISDETGSGVLVFGTAPTLDKPVVNQIDATQAASATTPAAGKSSLYVNSSDAKLHVVDSSGNDVAVGSGSSGRNYLSDWYDAAKAVGTITNSIGDTVDTSDRTGNETTWGSDGTDDVTFSDTDTETLSSSALRQSKSYVLKHVSTGAGFIESPLFSLDKSDLGKPLTVSFDVSGVATSDDWQVYVVRYDTDDLLKERIAIAGTASATSPYSARIPTGTSSFQGFFIAGSTSTDQYALRFVRNSASDTTNIIVDSLYVGPQSVVQGAAVTDWVSFTPSWTTLGTTSNNTGFWRRVGDSMQVQVYVTASASGSGANLALTIPGSYRIDTTKVADITNQGSELGNASWYDSDVTDWLAMSVRFANSTSVGFSYHSATYDTLDGADIATGDIVSAMFMIPISGWSSNVTIADRAVEHYYYTSDTWDGAGSTTAEGAGGQQMGGALTAARSKVITYNHVANSTDKLAIELSWDRINWVSSNQIAPYQLSSAGSDLSGVYLSASTATSATVTFAQYRVAGNDDAPTSAWLASMYWRLRVTAGGASVGFPVSTANIVGRTDGLTVGSGYIGEIKTSDGSNTSLTTGQYNDGGASPVSLEAGVWDIQVIGLFNPAASTTITAMIAGIGTATGNSGTGLTIGNYTQWYQVSAAPGAVAIIQTSPMWRVNLSSTTSYYGKVYAAFGTSTMTGASYIRARRVA